MVMATLSEQIKADIAKREKAKQESTGIFDAMRKSGLLFNETIINPNKYNAPAANRFKDSALGLLSGVPGVGDYASGAQAADYWNRGEKGNALLAGLGALPLVPAIGGMFIGKGAKTWDVLKAQQANELLAKGIDPREVWKQTGTMRGADKALRQEIPDNLARAREYQLTPAEAMTQARQSVYREGQGQVGIDRVAKMEPYAGMSKANLIDNYKTTGGEIIKEASNGNKGLAKQLMLDREGLDSLFSEMSNRNYGPASSFLKHGDLGAAYPDVYKMHTRITPDMDGRGVYMRDQGHTGEQINLNNKPTFSDDKSTMLHELQHAIQQREGWARGGDPEAMGEYLSGLRTENSKLNGIVATSKGAPKWEAQKLLKDNQEKIKQFSNTDNTDYSLYKRLAGEAEARLTQSRMNMTMPERLASYPPDMFDVPMDQQIVRMGDNGPAMQVSPPHLNNQDYQRMDLPEVTYAGLGDTWAGYPTQEAYQAKLAADDAQALRIRDSYRNGDSLTARYGIQMDQNTPEGARRESARIAEKYGILSDRLRDALGVRQGDVPYSNSRAIGLNSKKK